MIYPLVLFPMIFSDPSPRFQGHGVIFRPTDALNVLSAQLTRDLFAIAKFLYSSRAVGTTSSTECPSSSDIRLPVCVIYSIHDSQSSM